MRQLMRLFILIITAFFISSCSDENLALFQENKPQKQMKLFEILDESPALKSLFTDVEPQTFNVLLDRLVRSDTPKMVLLMKDTVPTFYGNPDTVVFPLAMRDISEGSLSFYNAYTREKEKFDASYEVLKDVLSFEPEIMQAGTETISDTLNIIKNVESGSKDISPTRNVDTTLDNVPVVDGSFELWVDGVLAAKDDSIGNITGSFVSGTINYTTGHFTCTLALTPSHSIEARYQAAAGGSKWNMFSDGQELGVLGYKGVTSLISYVDILNDFYGRNPDLDNPASFMEDFLLTIQKNGQDSGLGVEPRINDILDTITDPEFAYQEKNIADWMIADRQKVAITTYAFKYFYPLMLNPVFANANVPADFSTMIKPSYMQTESDYKNFIRRGRWIVDDAASVYTASPYKLTGFGSQTMFLKSFIWALSEDIKLYDDLEKVPVFDFVNNDMLRWSAGIVSNNLNPALNYTSNFTSGKIEKSRLSNLLWNGWTYTAASGATKRFEGLFFVANKNPDVIASNDGYVTKMAKTRSLDYNEKPFRKQVNDILNGNNNGYFKDDTDNNKFKLINSSYGATSESQIESIMTNLQLYLLSYYYSSADRKWALTPEDSTEFFGDPNRNMQSLYGNMSTSLRNLVTLDRSGVKRVANGIPIINELLYVVSTGYGITAPDPVAPPELTMHNCFRSMGAPNLQTTDYIPADTGLLGIINVYALSSDQNPINDIFRKSAYEASGVNYATQRYQTALELLQPGTFRRRVGGQAYEWHGRFAASQGDLRGIVNSDDKIVTSNFVMTELALAGWEGYGPYTYKGKAPNGSDCKYKNDWMSDSYQITGRWFGNLGPGMSSGYGSYHVYERIYKPTQAELNANPAWKSGFVNYDENGNVTGDVAKVGFFRDNAINGSYTTVAKNDAHAVVLDCFSREEAIKKNIHWLLNQKKYMFMIPLHPSSSDWRADMEMFVYVTISANGVAGIANAKRYSTNVSDNAKWGSGLSSSTTKDIRGKNNTVLYTTTSLEPSGTSRFMGVSFNNQDYCVAIDYTYNFATMVSWWPALEQLVLNSVINIPNIIWTALGGGAVLPSALGDNMAAIVSLANKEYAEGDLMYTVTNRTNPDILKFKKYYDDYYADAGLFNGSVLADKVKASDLPPVPRVKGVSYPTAFDSNGAAISTSWVTHTGDNKGKFEDILGVTVCTLGTIHEDGKIFSDIAGTTPATYAQINSGNIAYFAKDGFRANIDNLILLVAAMNESTKSATNAPSYNTNSWLNILIDNNGGSMRPDLVPDVNRNKGVIPTVLSSKYLNINNPGPIKDGIEGVIKHTIRTYFNYFDLTRGYDGPKPGDSGAPDPSAWTDLLSFYKLDTSGNKVDEDGDGYSDINPDLNWNVPINRFRYLTSDRSIDQMERMLDYIRDLSYDTGGADRPSFKEFVKQSIIAFNTFMRVNYMDENPDGDDSGAFALNITDENLDSFISFIQETDYKKVFDLIRTKRLNDLEKFYNFKIDDWLDALSPGEMKDVIDELNVNLVKFFGINLKEGYIDGIYNIRTGANMTQLEAKWWGAFLPGETVYGYGKYIAIDTDMNGDGTIDDSDRKYPDSQIITEGVDDDKRYFEYLDIKDIVLADLMLTDNDANRVLDIAFAGVNEFFEFKRLDEIVFEPYCTEYVDLFYRAGSARCPNVFNLHNYDPRMDWAMDKYNKFLIEDITADVFQFDQAGANETYTIGKGDWKSYSRPTTMIDWLYGRGTTGGKLSLENEMNFLKDLALDKFFDETEMTLPNPNASGDLTDSPRDLAAVYRTFINDKLTGYEYTKSNVVYHETYEPEISDDIQDGHLHAINNVLELISELLDPNSPNYKSGQLYTFWENFMNEANDTGITGDKLISVRDSIGAIFFDRSIFLDRNMNGIWDDQEPYTDTNLNGKHDATESWVDANGDGEWNDAEPTGEHDPNSLVLWSKEGDTYEDLNSNGKRDDGYTKFFSNVTARAPKLMKAYEGHYNELVDMAVIAFEKGGIAEYAFNTMKGGDQYELYDFITEFNTLLNQDIFKEYTNSDTFWWQMGSMMESMALMIESKPGYPILDYYDKVQTVFR